MRINIESPINKYYVQTLAMIFFPGEKFGEAEEESPDVPALDLKTEYKEEGVFATAEIRLGDRVCRAEKLTEYSEHRTKERTLKIAVGAVVLAACGELKGYTEMMNDARKNATDRMIEQAEAMGADAIVAVRYSSSAVMDGAAEIMAYGTAVKFI